MLRPWSGLLVLFAAAGIAVASAVAVATIAPPFKNCTQLNHRYPHGVGRLLARDRTSGERVTTFKRSNRLYALAMSHNRGLDRDHDGIACEQA